MEREKGELLTYAYHASVALHRISRRTRLARRFWNGNTHVTHKPYLLWFANGLVVSNLHVLYAEMSRRRPAWPCLEGDLGIEVSPQSINDAEGSTR